MEKERKITAPEGCEIKKVEIVDGAAIVTFCEKEQKLPRSWEEFCEIRKVKEGECFINAASEIFHYRVEKIRDVTSNRNIFPDHATAKAVLALCQLIQLRNAYNGDWIPNWKDQYEQKYTIEIEKCTLLEFQRQTYCSTILYFKSEELRDEFLRCFRPLIEKLKPLYGIKEGGAE